MEGNTPELYVEKMSLLQGFGLSTLVGHEAASWFGPLLLLCCPNDFNFTDIKQTAVSKPTLLFTHP